MRQGILLENRTKQHKHPDQNQSSSAKGTKFNGANPPKTKSSGGSWGSQIVRGFTTDRKTKVQSAISNNKKPSPASLEIPKQKNHNGAVSLVASQHSRVKRSLISDYTCSSNVAQVHPHVLDHQSHHQWTRSPASHDLFRELDHLRTLFQESKKREKALQTEVLELKLNPNPSVRELEAEKSALEYKVSVLETEKSNLALQLSSSSSLVDQGVGGGELGVSSSSSSSSKTKYLEIEVMKLRRLNKELQLQQRNLTLKLSLTEAQLASLKKLSESDVVVKAEAEAEALRHNNEDLCKQVEGLQMSRLNEVEEVAYLRWINSCLRQELDNSDHQTKNIPEKISFREFQNLERTPKGEGNSILVQRSLPFGSTKSSSVQVNEAKKITVWPKIDEHCQVIDSEDENVLDRDWLEANEGRGGGCSPGLRRHSISGPKGCIQVFEVNKRRQSDGFIFPKELEIEKCGTIKSKLQLLAQKYDFDSIPSPRFFVNRTETNKLSSSDVQKRALRIPNPPPRPCKFSPIAKRNGSAAPLPPPPPPPPPPLPKLSSRNTNLMQKAPQVVELYHSLMKRDSKKESSNGGVSDATNVADVRSSMIGEIENRSSYLLAIKADVETQGEFVGSLIKEVNGALFRNIEDVVAFVKWLDDELSFLVDERAVLKHFEWPEKKADTLREAAFGYRDLMKLEVEVTHYEDDPRMPRDVALKKMAALAEKMEHSVYNIMRTRETTMRHCKEFRIPTDWMLDAGIISKIKFASVKLAKKYMKRVASEFHGLGTSDKDPSLEYMLLQGVRFAFRIHQFAGGFDAETMHAFEELRNLALVGNKTS